MTHYDIALIGSGSGNSFPGPELAEKSIVYIDRGIGPDRVFGGTCLNAGCIPTKMLVHTADVAISPHEAGRLDLREDLEGVDWPAIRERVFADRIDPISRAGLDYRENHADNANLTLLRGLGRFTAPGAMTVELNDGGTQEITADTFILGAGSRATLPEVEGLAEIDPLTSDTVMRIDALPSSLLILGSGVIASEFAHIMSGLGVDVTIIARSEHLLRHEEQAISEAYTELTAKTSTVVTSFAAQRAWREDGRVHLLGVQGEDAASRELVADEILVATGRRANADTLAVQSAGIGCDDAGRVRTDPYQRVLDESGEVLEGYWAFGDLSSPAQLKHVANHQERIMRHNVLHPEDLRRSDTMPIPRGIFGRPQVAAIGMTEREARQSGRRIRTARQDYSGIAFGWALEDTTSFMTMHADADTGEILGCHIMGPEATVLIQPIIQAMSLGQRVQDIARTQYWIHPALPELIENALLQLLD